MRYFLRDFDVLFRTSREPPDELEQLDLHTGEWYASAYLFRQLQFVKELSPTEAAKVVKTWGAPGIKVEGLQT
jgi:hypothetical protein